MAFFDTISLLLSGRLASIGSIQLDASVSEIHSSQADITEFPVEDGSNITDHINKKPDVVQIEGIVSNTPIKSFTDFFGAAPIKSLSNSLNGISNDLAKTAYEQLLEIVEGNELITIITSLRTYENMAIESFSVNRDSSRSDSLHFTAVAREITLVQTAESSLLASVTPQELRGQPNKKTGNKATKALPATPTVPESPPRSALRRLIDKNIAVPKK